MVEVEFIENIVLDTDFEGIYPIEFQIPLADKKRLLNTSATFIYIINKETKEPIGETFYLPVRYLSILEDKLKLGKWLDKNAAYVYKNTILPQYQGLGYGRLLTEHRIKKMKEQGYRYSVGHARHNGSIKQAKLFGAEPVSEVELCGETTTLCALDLLRIPVKEVIKEADARATMKGHHFLEKMSYKDGFRDGINFVLNNNA